MKKFVLSMMTVAGFLFMGTVIAEAQEKEATKATTTENVRSGFVDADGDGVCDRYDGTRPGKGLREGQGEGVKRDDGTRRGMQKGLRDGRRQKQEMRDGTGQGRGRGDRQQLRNGTGQNCPNPQK